MNFSKTIINTLTILFLGMCFVAQAQNKKGLKLEQPRTVKLPTNTTSGNNCKAMNIRNTETILRDRVGRTLKLKLDKDYGFVEIMGKKQGIAFTEFVYKKPGHNWRYYLNDVNSRVTRVRYSKKHYYFTIEFEADKSEVKGKCPGCLKRFRDSRAPDIQWRNPKIEVKLIPVAFSNSLSFSVVDVEILGKFETNGAIKAALPSIMTHFKRQIKKAVRSQIKQVLNSSQVKPLLANAFKNEIRRLGLTKVRHVDMSKTNIYLCE